MKIKPYFFSINLRGNKIFNAKVETPTEDEHIVNKAFVDGQQVYDTEKAQEYSNSFKFDWVQNIYNKTFKQIFDDLFFPRVLPTYINPTITNAGFYLKNINLINDKFFIFNGQNLTFEIVPIILSPDRTLIGNLILTITNSLGTTTYQLTNGIFSGTVKFESDMTLVISGTYSTSPIKVDSYGDEYQPVEFGATYQLSTNITQEILGKLNIKSGVLISDILAAEGVPTYDDNDIPNLFTLTLNKDIPANTEGIFNFLIPEDYFKVDASFDYPIYFNLYRKNNGISYLENVINVKYSWLTYYSDATVEISGTTYVKCQYNFGIFKYPTNVEIQVSTLADFNTKYTKNVLI